MLAKIDTDMTDVTVVGSGVAGLCCAYVALQAGLQVRIITASQGPDASCCSWWAGGMLAPFCEQESAEPLIEKLGLESMAFWRNFAQEYALNFQANGSLVIAAPRDQSMLQQFEQQTPGGQRLSGHQIAELEPDLSHLEQGLWFAQEAHLEPRAVITKLWTICQNWGADLVTGNFLSDDDLAALELSCDWLIDCRGLAARSAIPDLRGVKGEMLHLHCPEINLSRPIRMLHPRHPIYLVPRPDQYYMLGATMLEVNTSKRAAVRSVLELLSAAYAISPAFADAEIVEIGVDVRPAYNDNLPKIRVSGQTIYLNGLYRHGFLAAPAMAKRVLDYVLNDQYCEEAFDANIA